MKTNSQLAGKMMVYAWIDLDGNKGEVKFGDHFVSGKVTNEEAKKHTVKYIRTQFPRRGKHFDSNRVQTHVWDISKYAKKCKKFYKASKIDDVIRPAIGHYGTVGKEFHTCSFDEVINSVNSELVRAKQPLVQAKLSTKQYNIAEEIINMFEDKQIILAELCARFGKTIWSASVVTEMQAEIVVVASYIKTVFSSFEKDMKMFEQFKHYEHIDLSSENYEEQVQDAINNGKSVVAYLSLANGDLRQDRIDYIFNCPEKTMLIVDEADFGAHTANQADPLITAVGDSIKTIIMTGTNADRAITHWKIDGMLSVTCPELLVQKKESQK